MKRASAMVAGCVFLAAISAQAQPHRSSGVFLQGGIFASTELLPHSDPDPIVTGLVAADASGTVAGGTMGIGVFLRPFLTLRAEVAVPATLNQDEESGISSLSVLSRTRVQNRDAYVFLGFETNADRRVRLSYLAGAVLRQQRVNSVLRIVSIGLPPFLPPQLQILDNTSVAYGTSLALGLDAAVAMSRRVSLVPQIRVVVFGGGLSIRPGGSVRWSF